MRLGLIKRIMIVLVSCLCIFSSAYSTQSFSQRQDVQQFINMMVKNYNFDKKNLEKIFDNVQIQTSILKTMEKPAEAWPWYKYQQFFITPSRISQGVDFWNQHAKTLKEIETKEGVPASVIVAIVGVETFYGQNQGNYRVLDALTTLAFVYPKRKAFFQNELKEYLLLARENQFDVKSMLGSYAGAIGQAQFMPSSYRNYAIDYRNTGVKDLRGDTDDVIASVGNYLKQHGWQANNQIASRAIVKGQAYQRITSNLLQPKYNLKQLAALGIYPQTNAPLATRATFLALEGKNDTEYWLGYDNFYVISRYNPRVNYTMAVYQLSESIKNARKLNSH